MAPPVKADVRPASSRNARKSLGSDEAVMVSALPPASMVLYCVVLWMQLDSKVADLVSGAGSAPADDSCV